MATTFRSEKATSQRRGSTRKDELPGPGNWPFFLAFSPMAWELVKMPDDQGKLRDVWLPRLTPFQLIPGLNGAKRGDNTLALAHATKQGFIPLRDDLPVIQRGPDGRLVEDVGYLCEHARRGDRPSWFFSCWQTPRVIGMGDRVSIRFKFDPEPFNVWRMWLLDAGKVPGPTEDGLELMMEVQRVRSNRRGREADRGAASAIAHRKESRELFERMKRAAADLAQFKTAHERLAFADSIRTRPRQPVIDERDPAVLDALDVARHTEQPEGDTDWTEFDRMRAELERARAELRERADALEDRATLLDEREERLELQEVELVTRAASEPPAPDLRGAEEPEEPPAPVEGHDVE